MSQIIKAATKLGYSGAIYIAVFIGASLALPSLDYGFMLDDYVHLSAIEEWYPEQEPAFNLYGNFLDSRYLPWFTSPDMHVSFWRPLSSALLRIDHALFERLALGYHIHSLLWLVGVIITCALVYSRLPSRVSSMALMIMALDECHAIVTSYIANRHSMVSVLPALLALHAHLRWREDGWRPGLPLSILGFVIGLMGGETAFGVLAYVVAFEVFAGPKDDQRSRPWVGLLPVVTIAIVYLTVYKFLGHGASGSGYYLDPTGDPVAFLIGAAFHVPALLGALLLAFPADLWVITELHPVQTAVSLIAIIGAACWSWLAWSDLPVSHRRALRWCVTGSVASLLPVAASEPSDRQLLVPMVGVAVFLGVVWDHAWQRWSTSSSLFSRWRRWRAGGLAVLVVAIHLVVAPLARIISQYVLAGMTPALASVATQIPSEAATSEPNETILINAPDLFLVFHVPAIYGYGQKPLGERWTTLSMAPFDQRLVRKERQTLELIVLNGQMLTSAPEQVIRPEGQEFTEGSVVRTRLFEAEIIEANDLGPTRVAFTFQVDIEDPRFSFLIWGKNGLQETELPAAGESILLASFPGPVQIR